VGGFWILREAEMSTQSQSARSRTTPEHNILHGGNFKDEGTDSTTEAPLMESGSQTVIDGNEKEKPSDQPKEEQQPNVSGIKRALIILPVTLVYFLVMLDNSIITTAIPQITDEFNSLLDVGWYGSAYQLASSAFVPLAGKIYTFFPTKVSLH
jgi:hypothetical protein